MQQAADGTVIAGRIRCHEGSFEILFSSNMQIGRQCKGNLGDNKPAVR
ncbi:hypothetical protein NEIELOOT_01224 [Neisseria elongata subsp. glycolytica ATCC 29315]|uniref:Uncharacterized protein n=1 Tax=Neisseria elongata subsp. glycolytica ATCC 29315 TaxID=546263 RepID=D4DQ87_NEIEG|nr:hypothetical protein NEIELOOT_01224 [Neisseria elongata subsp. glycolytica ATCC 29315]